MASQWITLTLVGGEKMTFNVRHIIAYRERKVTGNVEVYTNEYEHDSPWLVREKTDEIAVKLA